LLSRNVLLDGGGGALEDGGWGFGGEDLNEWLNKALTREEDRVLFGLDSK
jgi:hypothetical protein